MYSGLGGVFVGAFLWPWLWRRRALAFRALPWSITAVLALVALLYSGQASHYAFYLPTAINERLIKAALWLTLAFLVCFYTALLHSLQKRPYGWRSRVAVGLLAAASVYVGIERRGAIQLAALTSPALTLQAAAPVHLLAVGIDTATLDAVLPLAEEGQLPFLAAALEEGAYGPLRSLRPHRPEALWTTLASGQWPYRHGILGGRAYAAPWLDREAMLCLLPAGLGFARWGLVEELAGQKAAGVAGSRSGPGGLRSPRLWSVFRYLGVSSAVVGWPSLDVAGEPAAALNRASDRFPLAGSASDAARLEAARAVLGAHQAQSVFVYLPGLAPLSASSFGAFARERFEGRGNTPPEEERAAAALAGYYRELDRQLAALWLELPEPRLLAVVSAFGTARPGTWERWQGSFLGAPESGGSTRRSPDGLLVLRGHGVRAGTLITGARLVDVVPTLLYATGLPVARDLDGRVLTEAFAREYLAARPLTFVPSYRAALLNAPLLP